MTSLTFRKLSLHDPLIAASHVAIGDALFPAVDLRIPGIDYGDRSPDGLPIEHTECLKDWGIESLSLGPTRWFDLHDAIVHAPHGLVTIGDYALTETLAHIPFHLPGYADRGDEIDIPAPGATVQMGAAFHASIGNANNYFHWMLDAVPKLQIAPLTDRVFHGPILLPPTETMAQKDIVSALAGGPSPLFTLAQNHAVHVAQLGFVPNMVGWGFTPNPHIAPLFDRLRAILPQRAAPTTRLYITRLDSGHRVMTNEEAVIALVRRFGFEIVSLTGATVADQAALFANATHIIAPHGAGLTNLVFCGRATKVLELHMGAYVNWCFRRLCGVRGLTYGCLVGQMSDRAEDAVWLHARRWTAPLDRLQETLESSAFLAAPVSGA